VALYALAGRGNPELLGAVLRLVAALVLLVVLPLATVVPALAALALVTAVWLALHAYELVWWREARAESRSLLASS
jgi:hypothetical protein